MAGTKSFLKYSSSSSASCPDIVQKFLHLNRNVGTRSNPEEPRSTGVRRQLEYFGIKSAKVGAVTPQDPIFIADQGAIKTENEAKLAKDCF
jgi:hypothetical protein